MGKIRFIFHWFGLAWFYGISNIVGYLMLIFLCIFVKYMISKYILLMIFLNEPELIFFAHS